MVSHVLAIMPPPRSARFAITHSGRTLLGAPAVVTALNIASILFILCAGFPKANAANLSPFAPFGARGVLSAAAVLFFSFVGFDYGACAPSGAPCLALPRPARPPACLSVAHSGML